MKSEKIKAFLFPILSGIILIALLQSGIVHSIFQIKILQLPLPFDIAKAFLDNISKILSNAVVTILPAICGLALGALIGYCAALFVTGFPNAGYGSLFLLTMINSVPVVALAPLMNRWFSGGFSAKLAVVTIAASGAMAVNAFRGLNDLPDNMINLMEANAASKVNIFIKLRIPNSLPSVFTGLKTAISAAMLAAIISEFFSDQTSGLGYMIKYSLKVGNQKQIGWAYIAAVSVLSVIIYALVSLAEKYFIKWHVSQRQLNSN